MWVARVTVGEAAAEEVDFTATKRAHHVIVRDQVGHYTMPYYTVSPCNIPDQIAIGAIGRRPQAIPHHRTEVSSPRQLTIAC